MFVVNTPTDQEVEYKWNKKWKSFNIFKEKVGYLNGYWFQGIQINGFVRS